MEAVRVRDTHLLKATMSIEKVLQKAVTTACIPRSSLLAYSGDSTLLPCGRPLAF